MSAVVAPPARRVRRVAMLGARTLDHLPSVLTPPCPLRVVLFVQPPGVTGGRCRLGGPLD